MGTQTGIIGCKHWHKVSVCMYVYVRKFISGAP